MVDKMVIYLFWDGYLHIYQTHVHHTLDKETVIYIFWVGYLPIYQTHM